MADVVADGGQVWIVVKVNEPRPACGHRQSNLVAICTPLGDKAAEEVAINYCVDETYLIGPIPLNTMLPDTPILDWPNSYYPYKRDPSAVKPTTDEG